MTKQEVDAILYSLHSNYRTVSELKLGSPEMLRLDNSIELTRAVYNETASVPEQLFARDLVELLLRYDKGLYAGFFSEEDLEECCRNLDGSLNEEAFSQINGNLAVYFNPQDLFLGGKIRPDVVVRRGKNDYIVFEVDSFMYHSTQKHITADKQRERKIQSLGYPVYRFSAKEILEPGGSWSCAVEAIEALKRHGFIKDTSKENSI